MKRVLLAIGFSFAGATASAEEFVCTYQWPGQERSHAALLDVQGNRTVVRGGLINIEFSVASNSPTEILLYRAYTKENSGSDYPVGFSTMSLDKQTNAFVYSNSFAGGDQNNHAKGTCEPVRRD
jgi:hypothetical protein